jgi:hypothetical protein
MEIKMKYIVITALLLSTFSAVSYSHSGRTDSKGGHNCSQKSIDKGLCTGYHYHDKKAYVNNSKGHEGHYTAIDSSDAHTHTDAHTHNDTKAKVAEKI